MANRKGEAMNPYEGRTLGNYHKCWYCGKAGPTTADHFWPKSMGGRIKVRACADCNQLKGVLTPNGWIDYLKRQKVREEERYDRMIRATQTLWDRIKNNI